MCIVLPFYFLLLIRRNDCPCLGFISLCRLQFSLLCLAIALHLTEWRISTSTASDYFVGRNFNYLQWFFSGQCFSYACRDTVTVILIISSFVINLIVPWFCFDSSSEGLSGDANDSNLIFSSFNKILVATSYFLQIVVCCVLMASMIISGNQMKQRLVLANSAPLHKSDLFRTAIRQLNIILSFCSICFLSTIIALILNLLETEYHFGIPTILLWIIGNFVPIIGLTLSALHLARNVRREGTGYRAEGSSSNNISGRFSRVNKGTEIMDSVGGAKQNRNIKNIKNGGGYLPLSPTSTNTSDYRINREEYISSNVLHRNESGSDVDVDNTVDQPSRSSFLWFNFRSSFSSMRGGSENGRGRIGYNSRDPRSTYSGTRDSFFTYNNQNVDIGELHDRLLMDDTSDEGDAFFSSEASDEGKYPDSI